MQLQLNGKTYYTYRFSGGEYSDAWESWHLHEELLDDEGIKNKIRDSLQELLKVHEQYLADQKHWEETRREFVLQQIGPVPQYVIDGRPNQKWSLDYQIREFVHLWDDERVYRDVGCPGFPQYGIVTADGLERYRLWREWCDLPLERRHELIEGITKDDFLRVTGHNKDETDYYERALELAGFITLKPAVEFEPYIDYQHDFLRVCSMVGAEYVP